MQATAWGPCDVQVHGCRGYRERHVFRVASTPQYQFQRAYSWSSRPVKVRAISEELVQRVHEENIQMNGTHLYDLPACKRQEPRQGTISVHGGEREGRPRVHDSLTTPIVQTATFTFRYIARHLLSKHMQSDSSETTSLLPAGPRQDVLCLLYSSRST